MHRPVTHLTKVYIEPTVACNLDCITCFRNAWDQPIGRMTEETFERILAGLKEMDPIPSVYFGGIGEPLFHPKPSNGSAVSRELGVKVELITNGTILTEKKSRATDRRRTGCAVGFARRCDPRKFCRYPHGRGTSDYPR